MKVTRMNMMNREDKEQKSKLRIIGVPKEEIKKSLGIVIITNERIVSILKRWGKKGT